MSYRAPTAQTASWFPLVSCRCTFLCRALPVSEFYRRFPHTALSAPQGCARVAWSADTQTWLADHGRDPAGARPQTGASEDDRSESAHSKLLYMPGIIHSIITYFVEHITIDTTKDTPLVAAII